MRKHILELQQGLCFYCDRTLGGIYTRKKRQIQLKTEWDHMVPFAYSQNNSTDNFVAACHVCNSLKGALMFQDTEQAKLYLFLAVEMDNGRQENDK